MNSLKTAFPEKYLASWTLCFAIFGIVLYCCAGGDALTLSVTNTEAEKSTRIDPHKAFPPRSVDDVSSLDKWYSATGFYWKRQEIAAGKRKVICYDFAPYSGQPSRQLYVYQVVGKKFWLMLFTEIWNPPKPGAALSFEYESKSDSLVISVDDIVCLNVMMRRLWQDY